MAEPRIGPLDEADQTEEQRGLLAENTVGTASNIFATLVRHPKLFKRWARFGGWLLVRGELPPRERELVILRTGFNCRSDYEWGQHVLIARRSGLTNDEIARVAQGPDAFGGLDRSLLRAADELHRQSTITDATWAELSGRLDERQLIELCMLVGQYHLVAMTLNALGVSREDGVPGLPG